MSWYYMSLVRKGSKYSRSIVQIRRIVSDVAQGGRWGRHVTNMQYLGAVHGICQTGMERGSIQLHVTFHSECETFLY